MMHELPQWYYDLNEPSKAVGTSSEYKNSQISKYSKPSFFKATTNSHSSTISLKRVRAQEDEVKLRRAWELAITPAKSVPLNIVMNYFSGSGMQIMSISMTMFMFFVGPLREIFSVQSKFKQLQGKHIAPKIFFYKLVYVACNLLAVIVGVYKIKQMGLLPTHPADWSVFDEPTKYFY